MDIDTGGPELSWHGTTMRPLDGGYSGETFLVGDPGGEVVVRIYRRNPTRCVVDASLLRLMQGVLPVPAVLEERPPLDDAPGVLVTERLPGTRLDVVLPTLDHTQRVQVAHHLGTVLARLSGVPMLGFGMFDGPDLAITDEGVPGDLRDWAEHFRAHGRLASWADDDFARLLHACDEAADQLAEQSRFVLVHSDLNPKNLLVDTETLHPTGLLDWEFAHAGSPYTDLGNLTRFNREPAFVDAVVQTLIERAPPLGTDPLLLARAADLWALVELAGGGEPNAVRRAAADLLLHIAREGDLTAWPWPGEHAPISEPS